MKSVNKSLRSALIRSCTFSLLASAGVGAQSCWKDTTCTGPLEPAFPGIWEDNIFAPSSRTVSPKSILSVSTGEIITTYPGPATLTGNGSQLVFDFGKETGGLATIQYTSNGRGSLGLAFTEAKNFIGEWSDLSSNDALDLPDGAIYGNVSVGNGTYTMPDVSLRGGFRYLTVFLITNQTGMVVNLQDISLEISFQPTWSNLRAYQGYFHSDNELLNRIWYSGAYTLQTVTIPANTGRAFPWSIPGWANNATVGPGDTIVIDGAKRDRAVWPGDLSIAVPSTFVSLGDLTSVKNALQVMYNTQNQTTGALPYSGPALSLTGSDTYHMWSMIGTFNYVLFTNDTEFLTQNWGGYKKAMEYVYGKVDGNGLLSVTGGYDWGRFQTGGEICEASMILYRTLFTGAELAIWMNDETGLNTTWATQALSLKAAINTYCWDDQYGAFRNTASTSSTIHPQDANSMAVLFSVASPLKAQNISLRLTENWGTLGAQAPEAMGDISPFISSFEIQAHFEAGHADRALELIRRSWGWYIDNPNGTESTMIEGYWANGTFEYKGAECCYYLPAYISHSHGWSTGPTSALTNYVVGISVTGRLGKTWKLAPQFGDLKTVEGGFTTALGPFWAKWAVESKGKYKLEFEMPAGTVGNVVLPDFSGGSVIVTRDGKGINLAKRNFDGGQGSFDDVEGGNRYVIQVG